MICRITSWFVIWYLDELLTVNMILAQLVLSYALIVKSNLIYFFIEGLWQSVEMTKIITICQHSM
jgi:hypothetical protein